MREIRLTQGKVALVDDEDYEWLTQWKWHAVNCKGVTWYARRQVTYGYNLHMHSAILGISRGSRVQIDHEDHNGLNNQRYNIRVAGPSTNQGNQKLSSRNRTGYKGVCFITARNKYQAAIGDHGEVNVIGRFNNPRDAALAYDTAAVAKWGEFACTNAKLGLL